MRKLMIIVCALVIFSCNDAPQRNFAFKYKLSLEANPLKNIKIWIPVPQSNEVQTISNLNIETEVDYIVKKESKNGNKYLYIELKDGLEKPIDIILDFNVNRKQRGAQDFANVSEGNYLMANRLVPVGERFDSIVAANSLRADKMDSVYKFVLNEMYYGKPKSTNINDAYYSKLPQEIKKGISKDSVVALFEYTKIHTGEYTFGNGNSNYACDISVGNCTDFHSYFMSLARSMEVPARFHIGFSIPKGKKGRIGGYHCWADYYNKTWIPVDISEADKHPEKEEFYCGNIDANRVEFSNGRDIILDNYSNGPVNFFIYPLIEIDGKLSDKYKKEFSFHEI